MATLMEGRSMRDPTKKNCQGLVIDWIHSFIHLTKVISNCASRWGCKSKQNRHDFFLSDHMVNTYLKLEVKCDEGYKREVPGVM